MKKNGLVIFQKWSEKRKTLDRKVSVAASRDVQDELSRLLKPEKPESTAFGSINY
eukprot:UN16398